MWRWADVREDVDMSRCEDEQMWKKMWTWADVKMSRCERRCEDEQMWRWADVREDVDMSRCEDEQMWEKIWRWADVKMSRCERRCEDEQVWRWEDVAKMWRWADVKMSRCERRCEDEQMWRWADVREDVKRSRCEDEKMWRGEDVEKKMWRWEDVLQTPTIGRTLRSDALGKNYVTTGILMCFYVDFMTQSHSVAYMFFNFYFCSPSGSFRNTGCHHPQRPPCRQEDPLQTWRDVYSVYTGCSCISSLQTTGGSDGVHSIPVAVGNNM